MAAEYGCEVVVDLSKLEHLPDASCYNNNWYKSGDGFIFVKCLEEYDQVNIYISDQMNGYKVFLISDHYNHDGIYSGEVGLMWT